MGNYVSTLVTVSCLSFVNENVSRHKFFVRSREMKRNVIKATPAKNLCAYYYAKDANSIVHKKELPLDNKMWGFSLQK